MLDAATDGFVVFDRVQKSYDGETLVVKDLNLDIARGDEILEPAPDGTDASDDFGDTIVSDCFIPQIVFSTTFGYRTDMVPEGVEPPSGACDVFDLETYPGKRALNQQPVANMEWALLCDGVPYDDVYDLLESDEGVDRALAKLDTIKDETIWWSAAAEPIQLLADGEVFMGSSYNGRLFSGIAEQDQPIGMAWDWQMFDIDGWVIPAGLPEDRLNRVLDFLRFGTDTQRLADQAAYISYGPARESSAPLVSTCRTRHRDGTAHADRSRQCRKHLREQLRMVGGLSRRSRREVPGVARAVT